jgi:putative ABC transport system permease protein
LNIPKMAWRNVLRNRRRSAVTITAMAFALFVEVLYAGLIPGYINAMEEDIVNLQLGDAQIVAPGYRDNPSIYSAIEDPDAVLARLDAAGFPAAPRLLGGGLAASGEFSSGVALMALDVERDGNGVSGLADKVAEGEWLATEDARGVVIGRRLAFTLNAKPGSELLLLSQATDGSMAHELYTVRGILSSVADGVDRGMVYLNAAAFRELMVMPTGAHQIIVRRPRELPLEEAMPTIRQAGEGLDVQSWKELSPIIAQMLQSVSGVIYILYFIIYTAVGILILNAMLMAVFERIKEFGVFKAIGAGPGRVFALIVTEVAIQTGIAMALGFLAALPGMYYLSTHGWNVGALGGMGVMGVSMRQVWFGYYNVESLSGPVIMLLVIVGLSVLYPAFKAAWISPVQAMRHQ